MKNEVDVPDDFPVNGWNIFNYEICYNEEMDTSLLINRNNQWVTTKVKAVYNTIKTF